VKMIVRGAMTQIGIGLAIGVPIAVAGGRALASQLFAVKSYEPRIIALAALTLGLAALLAGLLPAMRAASTDPIKALRSE